MIKKIFLSLLTVLLILVVWQWELVTYGIAQGKGQLSIIRNAVPVEEVLVDHNFPDSLKEKIEIIQQAKRFAVALGIKESDNYSTFYQQEKEVLLWNVSASEPYALEPHTWWFPIVGSVPYKGYFDKEKAIAELRKLENEGLDARMRPVGGWSTLGWFEDPILSSMLERSEGQLAELIIHELTHGTIFVTGEVEFNENLAAFIGEQGARLYLLKQHGDSSSQLLEYLRSEQDSQKFRDHVLRGTQRLDSLYTGIADFSDQDKKQLKNELIGKICDRLDTIQFYDKDYSLIFKNAKPNNAYFMSFLRYHSSEDSLSSVLASDFQGDLVAFIKRNVELHGK